MTSRFSLALWLCFLSLLQARPYDENFEFSNGQAFAFIGETTTYDGHYCQYIENFFATRYPDRKLIYYNAGNKNDTAGDVLARLEADVIPRKIDHAIVLLGTWDAGFEDFSSERFDAFRKNLTEILDKLDKAGIDAILLTPSMFDIHTRRERMEDETYRFRMKPIHDRYNSVMAYYGTWLRELAVERELRFADTWGALNGVVSYARKENPDFSLTPDAVFPDEGGHAVIAATVIEALAPARADGIGTLQFHREKNSWESHSSGGTLKNVGGDERNLKFIWEARSLPWAFPDQARFGADLIDTEGRFNQETLQVADLPAGDYELFIAEEKMPETYTHLELADGIAIHRIEERPQLSRALKVAELNAKRYEEAIYPLRDLWQRVKKVRLNFPEEPERVPKLMEDLKSEMEVLRQKAREQGDKVYEAAQPLARQYTIKKILTEAEKKAAEAGTEKEEKKES